MFTYPDGQIETYPFLCLNSLTQFPLVPFHPNAHSHVFLIKFNFQPSASLHSVHSFAVSMHSKQLASHYLQAGVVGGVVPAGTGSIYYPVEQ